MTTLRGALRMTTLWGALRMTTHRGELRMTLGLAFIPSERSEPKGSG
jgi:hypothetical protein